MYEIIIVGDGFDPPDELLSYASNISIYKIEKSGPCAARNYGCKYSRSDVVLFLDDDTVASHSLLERHIEYMEIYSDVSVAGGKVLGHPSSNKLANYSTYREYLKRPVTIEGNILSIITANCAFRKQAFDAVGGFSTIFDDYNSGAEDLDISTRIIKKGYNIGYLSDAIVWHHNRETIDAFMKQNMKNGYGLFLCVKIHDLERRKCGISDKLSLLNVIIYLIKFIYITDTRTQSKSLISRFCQYIQDKNLRKRNILPFLLYDVIRRCSLLYGQYLSYLDHRGDCNVFTGSKRLK